jgi:hypothetical protein
MTSSAALPPSRTCIPRQIPEINNLKEKEEKKRMRLHILESNLHA